jgi:predicted phosphate transport protein (TIGR00153 family)
VARFRLIPREEKFYKDFLDMAEHICTAARLLEEMVSSDPSTSDKKDEIRDLEHRCDFLTHEVIQRLHRTFVTPIDREDIHALAKALDDVMDAIDDSAFLFVQYRITEVGESTRKFCHITASATEQIRAALQHMEKRENVTPCVVEINRLENEADRLYQEVITKLFDTQKDPILILKWKEIFDYLEATVDSIEDVSDVIQGVVLKHA